MGTNQNEPKKKKSQLNTFAKYTAIGGQMLITIVLGNYIGEYLDDITNSKQAVYKKWIGLLGVVIAVSSVLWQLTRQIKNRQSKKK